MLKLWTDGTETYVAESIEDAMRMQRETLGENPEPQDWEERIPLGPLTIHLDDGQREVTRTAEEWIASNGPGFLCSTEF